MADVYTVVTYLWYRNILFIAWRIYCDKESIVTRSVSIPVQSDLSSKEFLACDLNKEERKDALNTFYGIGHMLQDHSDKEREGRNEGNVLFNDALNTFYGIGRMLQDHSDKEREGRKEMFYLMMHSTHFMASDICYKITQIRREKEGRKEMFYLMTHSTHFMASDICYKITQIRREKEGRKCFI